MNNKSIKFKLLVVAAVSIILSLFPVNLLRGKEIMNTQERIDEDLSNKIVSASFLFEKILKTQEVQLRKEVEASIIEKEYDYSKSILALETQTDPLHEIDYQSLISTVCVLMKKDKSLSVCNIKLLKLEEKECYEDEPIPVKRDNFVQIEPGKYKKQGLVYHTQSGIYDTYIASGDYFIKAGNETIEVLNEKVKYGEFKITCKTAEELLKEYDAGEKLFEEYDDRLLQIKNSGLTVDGLIQSLSLNTQTGEKQNKEIQELFSSTMMTATPNQQLIIKTAITLIDNVPYEWGGKAKKIGYDENWYTFENGKQRGLDCSGFVQWVFLTAGAPNDLTQKLVSTRSILNSLPRIKKEELQIGDFGLMNEGEKINHVGIYIGDGNFIHCNSTKKTVSIDKVKFNVFVRIPNLNELVLNATTSTSLPQTLIIPQSDIFLLAKFISYEAKGEGLNAWVGVGEVIDNRIKSNAFPNKLVDVIYEPGAFEGVENIEQEEPTQAMLDVARMILTGKVKILNNEQCLYFKNSKQSSNNGKLLSVFKTINRHLFLIE